MAWNYSAAGTAAALNAGVALMTGDGGAEEAAVIPNVISGAQSALAQFVALNNPTSISMAVSGQADASSWTVNMKIQTVHLDPDGRIIANAYPQLR